MKKVDKWDLFEVSVEGRTEGNPFRDYEIKGCFEGAGRTITVDGFYDGEGVYKVRFMPAAEGIYKYSIAGSFSDKVTEGRFEVSAPSSNRNHGRVHVVDQTALAYEDGTPYYSIGTTCYAWVHQSEELQEQTLRTLSENAFNKIRFCFFPKHYDYNRKEPISYPFERGQGEGIDKALVEKEEKERVVYPGVKVPVMDLAFDYTRPNVEHFKRFDLRIRQLRDMGIEADMILMHPYDRWGLNDMNREACDAYIRYVVARYGAFRNVWWSLSNEYDFIRTKTIEDWDRYGSIIEELDVYHHMCSIHNGMQLYDYSRSWITHLSVQRVDFYRHVEYTDEYLEKYKKPVLWDEICYEGNISVGWGNITAQELVRRFWEAFMRGGHAGHGETYLDDNDILWWSHGGILKGESGPRLAFLKQILEETPTRYLKCGWGIFDEVVGYAEGTQESNTIFASYDYCIHYLGICRPAFRTLYLPENGDYQVEVIDTWNMTITSEGVYRGECEIKLPEKQYMAIRITKVS